MQRVLYIIDAFPRPQTASDGQNDALEQCTKVTLSAIKWAKRCVLWRVCEEDNVSQVVAWVTAFGLVCGLQAQQCSYNCAKAT